MRNSRMQKQLAAVLAAAMPLAGATVWADQFIVEDRELASIDPSGGYDELPVWEACVAAGPEYVMTVFNNAIIQATDLGYAVFDRDTETWFDDLVPPGDGSTIHDIDPVLTYDAATGDFLLVELAQPDHSSTKGIWARTYTPSTDTWGSWVTVYSHQDSLDKPWLAAGEVYTGDPDEQEFYVVFRGEDCDHDDVLYYGRSTDSGASWNAEAISVDDEDICGTWPFIAAYDDNEPYVSYVDTGYTPDRIYFLIGTDDDSSPSTPAVEFEPLLRYLIGPPPGGGDGLDDYPLTSPLYVPLYHTSIEDLVPGTFIQMIAGPQIAVDPTDPDKLYVVFADTETDDEEDTDVNIYFQMLERGWEPTRPDAWRANDRIEVNDDNIAGEQDQMLPAIAVDSQGVIYITFYDDRDFDQDDEDEEAQWNVYITYSTNGGETWSTNTEIEEDWDQGDTKSDPAYDETLDHDVLKPGEYMGIAVFEGYVGQEEVREIWTAFAGISDDDPSQDRKSVIWSNRNYWTSE